MQVEKVDITKNGTSTRVACHNIITQAHPEEKTLKYSGIDVKVVAHIIIHLQQVHGQQFGLKRGLKEFGEEGVRACKEELAQMHSRVGFRAVAVAELTRLERVRAQEGLMLLTEKSQERRRVDSRIMESAPGTGSRR